MPESLRIKTANKLRQIRTDRGLSQTELAKLIGIERTTVNKIEQGQWSFSIDILERFSKALDFDLKLIKKS